MTVQAIASALFVLGGLFFLLLGAVGLVKFPDFFTRLHPAGKADTLGASLLLIGLAIYAGPTLLALKILLVAVFILFVNPASAHALGRAAYKKGLKPWLGQEGGR